MRYFLLFFVVVGFLHPRVALAQSKCDQTKIQTIVNDIVQHPEKYDGAREISIKLDAQIAKGNLEVEDKNASLVNVWEYKIRKGLNCPIPKALETEVMGILFSKDEGGRDCDIRKYKRTVDRKVTHLRRTKQYDTTIDQAAVGVSQHLGEAMQKSLNQNLQDPDFRDVFLRSLVEAQVLQERECGNAREPVMKIINKL